MTYQKSLALIIPEYDNYNFTGDTNSFLSLTLQFLNFLLRLGSMVFAHIIMYLILKKNFEITGKSYELVARFILPYMVHSCVHRILDLYITQNLNNVFYEIFLRAQLSCEHQHDRGRAEIEYEGCWRGNEFMG